MKKAQSSLEYLLLIGGAVLVAVIIIVILIAINTAGKENVESGFEDLLGGLTGGTSTNLLANPGFESGSGANADNWTEPATLMGRVSGGGEQVKSGTYSMEYSGAITTAPGRAVSQAVSVTPNTGYTISGYAYVPTALVHTPGSPCSGTPYVYLDFNDISGECSASADMGTRDRWQRVRCTITAAAIGARTTVTVRAVVDNCASGSVWFDDISLTQA